MQESLSRRDFLRKLRGLSALGLLYMTGGCERLVEKINSRPVRRDLSRLSPADPVIQAYRHAVAAMKALPPADPRNWQRLAQLHRNQRPRRNWYFLPWHRAYLACFEKICRQLSGYPQFALPYWNWASHPAIPSAFWSGGVNSLLNSTRLATPSDSVDPALAGPGAMNNVFNQTNFLAFGGSPASAPLSSGTAGVLESASHNGVLNLIGGDMATSMAPLDPLFWPHQGMIDRCWVEWNLHRRHDNPSDPRWKDFSFPDFPDESGNPVSVTVQETALFPIFNYGYEDPPSGNSIPGLSSRAEIRALEDFARKGAPARWNFSRRFELKKQVELEIGGRSSMDIRIDPSPIALALESGRSRLLLTVEDSVVAQPGDFFVRVFVNQPDASASTSISDPNYAGSFAFLLDEEQEGVRPQGASFLVDITDTLRRLNQSGSLANPQQAGIQLVAAPFANRKLRTQKMSIGRVELGVLPDD
jgi:tyrosinase